MNERLDKYEEKMMKTLDNLEQGYAPAGQIRTFWIRSLWIITARRRRFSR